MGRRRLAREIALQALYVADVAHTPALEAFALVTRREGEELDAETLVFARELALGAIERVEKLDLTIQEQAANWSMVRMAAVDRNVLRLAAYELEARPDTPVGVIIDEADAALGNREQSGDSGTQNRVFASIAACMGDTRNRGKILWFLITCRPDLLPIDLKRQGRAEEHVPLFYPETVEEYDEIYRVMVKKLGLSTTVTSISGVATSAQLIGLSGSDLEAVLVRAVLEAESDDSRQVTEAHLAKAIGDFIPPANSLERELQILVAVLESTSRELLPERYRHLERAAVQSRVNELKMILRG